MISSKTKHHPWKKKIHHFFSKHPNDLQSLIEVIRLSAQHRIIDADSLNMIEGVLSVSEKQARDIMIPKPNMVMLSGQTKAKDCLAAITESQHSRFPVIDEATEKVIGILLAKDLLSIVIDTSKQNWQIQRIMRPAKIVPESKRLDVLLKEFREHRNHMAIVIDEYGLTAGLITIEDVLEEIVGDIADEFDSKDESPTITKKSKTTFVANAITSMEDFNEFFHTNFQHDDFDTIGGLLLKKFSRIPKKGDTISVESIHFTIISADQRGIKKVKIKTKDEI